MVKYNTDPDTESIIREEIILAALLHDIGKFYQRAFDDESELLEQSKLMEVSICPKDNKTNEYTRRHVLWTNEFFEKYKQYFPINIFRPNTKDNCANLASYHHYPNTLLKTIIQEADRLSAGMDRLEKDIEDEISGNEKYKKVRLHSIFEKISLSNITTNLDRYRYELNPLFPLKINVFPKLKEKLTPLEGESLVIVYNKLWNEFINEFKNLPKNDFNTFLNSLIFLLEKYTWCIPSSTIDFPDISLFDHLKTTAAIAICLFEYHKNSLEEINIKNPTEKKFILIGGDLSGIQKYIFNFSHSNVKGVTKRLKARSFYLSALIDISTHFILHKLNLPLICNIMNAGGRFILLVPNTEEVKTKFNDIYQKITSWYYNTFAGEIILNLDWSLEITPNDLKIENFCKILEQLNKNIEDKKNQKLFEFLTENNKWKKEKFIIDWIYQNKVCESCEKNPATETDESINLCKHCFDQKKIGEWLVKSKILAYSTKKPNFEKTISFFDGQYYISFFENTIFHPTDFYLIEELYDFKTTISNYGNKVMANNVPVFYEEENIEELCSCCSEKDKCEIEKEPGKHKTFQCIATKGIRKEKDKEIGSSLLGILKADVDKLGLIFSLGLGERLSISRYATLSRMLNLFFAGYIEELCHSEFRNVYVVYSGGDDLFLISDWETIIEFAKKIYFDFKNFTCQNKDITLSAGITLIKPNFPIARGAILAEELLKESKNGGRDKESKNGGGDKLTLFSTTVEWSDLDELFKFGKILDEEYKKDDSKIKSSFLYRLLKYHNMYLETKKDNYDIRNLMFHSLMAYDVKRNIEQKEKINGEEKIINEELIKELQKLYKIPPEEKLMKNLKIPLFWILYRNRGRK